MALAIDASSTAVVWSNSSTSITTDSFTPPAASLIVVRVIRNTSGGTAGSVNVTNSGDALSWTVVKCNYADSGISGAAIIGYAWLASSRAITVTATATPSSAAQGFGIQVAVVTGSSEADPVGDVGRGGSTTNDITPTVLTTTANGSWVIGVGTEYNGLGTPTTADTSDGAGSNAGGDVSGIMPRKSAATASSGTAVTLNFNAYGSGGAAWNWVAVEVLAAAAGGLSIPVAMAQYRQRWG